MKNCFSAVAVALGVVVCFLFTGTGFGEVNNSVNVGGGAMAGADTTATAVFGEYERLLGARIALFVRGGKVSYEFDDGTDTEEGDPQGFDIGVRAYPTGDGGMKGFFVGGAIGSWKTDWTFTDDTGTSFETRGKGTSSAIRADIEVGGRFNLGTETVSLMPALHIGHFISSDDDCTYTFPAARAGQACTNESEAGLYGFFALSLGIAF